MNTCKLIFRNVCKNIRDYLIYFLTLTLSVSLFYAFNSISDQPAFFQYGHDRYALISSARHYAFYAFHYDCGCSGFSDSLC